MPTPELRDRVLRALGVLDERHKAPPPHKQSMHGRKGPKGLAKGAVDLLADRELRVVSDDELLDLFAQISRAERLDEKALRRIDAELARREDEAGEMSAAANSASVANLSTPIGDLSAVDDDGPVQRRIDDLVASGRDYRSAYAEAYNLDPDELTREDLASIIDAQRAPGETREHVVRRLYNEVTHLSYLRAESWTRGNVLSKAGRSADIDPISLFSGPRVRARKYASDELKEFWERVEPRQTYTEFRAAMLRRPSDVVAAGVIAQQGQEQDFGL